MAIRPPFRDGDIGIDRATSPSVAARHRREETPEALPSAPECPFCNQRDTEIMNSFGSHASVCTYWCRACGTPFDFMKWKSTS
jgi:transcription elongation factor Elf1